jgi:hypothetical protein
VSRTRTFRYELPNTLGLERGEALAGDAACGVVHGSAIVVDDLDVVPIGVEDERAVVAGVVTRDARRARRGSSYPAASAAAWKARTVASSPAGKARWMCSVSGRSSSISEKP